VKVIDRVSREAVREKEEIISGLEGRAAALEERYKMELTKQKL
jgi:hypothetical protein